MADRYYQQYPGQLNPAPTYPPYPSASPQPGYGGQRPAYPPPVSSTQGYPTPPPASPQPPYPTSYAPSPYEPPPQYGQQAGYGRPPPPGPQSYGETAQSQAFRQQTYQHPPRSPYPQNSGYGYVRCFYSAAIIDHARDGADGVRSLEPTWSISSPTTGRLSSSGWEPVWRRSSTAGWTSADCCL